MASTVASSRGGIGELCRINVCLPKTTSEGRVRFQISDILYLCTIAIVYYKRKLQFHKSNIKRTLNYINHQR